MDLLKGAKYFTVMDILSAYHQVEVETDSVEKTAFVCEFGQYSDGNTVNPASMSLSSVVSTSLMCCSAVWLKIRMSSKKTARIFHFKPL